MRSPIHKRSKLLDAAQRLWLRGRPTLSVQRSPLILFYVYVYFHILCVAGTAPLYRAPSIGTEREESARRDLLLGNYAAEPALIAFKCSFLIPLCCISIHTIKVLRVCAWSGLEKCIPEMRRELSRKTPPCPFVNFWHVLCSAPLITGTVSTLMIGSRRAVFSMFNSPFTKMT